MIDSLPGRKSVLFSLFVAALAAMLFVGRATADGNNAGGPRINAVDGAAMVWVPAGAFVMGSDVYSDEQPVHSITLDGYWICKNLVTVAQYKKYCAQTGHAMPNPPPWGLLDNHPVVNVSWDDADAYCRWAGTRLPTEAEYEKAARGTQASIYPWGNDWDSSRLCCSKRDWQDAGMTTPVGSFPSGASPYGCLDMEGELFEWCSDWYNPDFYKSSPAHNPTGPGTGSQRVTRGCSWCYFEPYYFRAAHRLRVNPSEVGFALGFRCALSP